VQHGCFPLARAQTTGLATPRHVSGLLLRPHAVYCVEGHSTYTCAVPPGHSSHTLCVVPTFGSSKVCAAETRSLRAHLQGHPRNRCIHATCKSAVESCPDQTGDRQPDLSRHSRPHQEKLQTKIKGRQMDRRVERYLIDSAGGYEKSVKWIRISRRVAGKLNPLIQDSPLVLLHLKNRSFEEGEIFKMLGKDRRRGRIAPIHPALPCPIKNSIGPLASGAGTWHAQETRGTFLSLAGFPVPEFGAQFVPFRGHGAPTESATPTVSRLSRHRRSAAMNRPQSRRSRRVCPGSVSISIPCHVSPPGSNCPRLLAIVKSTTSLQLRTFALVNRNVSLNLRPDARGLEPTNEEPPCSPT